MIPYIAAPWILWVLNSHGLCWTLFPWPRRYRGMIIDAGSTGSRVWIFAWSPGPCQHDALPSMVTPTVVASYQVKGGYGSIPIDTFLVGWTSINPSYDLGFTRYQGFDPSPGGLSSASAKLNDTLTELLNFAEDILKDRKEDRHLPNMVWSCLIYLSLPSANLT